MSPAVIADSIVNLCGAIGLSVAIVTLNRRDPRSPLTRRLLVALGVTAVLLFLRGVAWWGGSAWLDRLSLLPAALVPLGALIVTEGILRRHAPRPVKIVFVLGGAVLGLAAPLDLNNTPHSIRCGFRCSSSPDSRLADCFWGCGIGPRSWHRRTAALGASPSAPSSPSPSSSPTSGCSLPISRSGWAR
jgi:hypothetical protein